MAAGTSDGQSRRRTSKSEKRGKPVPAGPGTLPTLFWRLVDLGFMLFFVLATLGGLFVLPYVTDDKGDLRFESWPQFEASMRSDVARVWEHHPALVYGGMGTAIVGGGLVISGILGAVARPGVSKDILGKTD